MIFQKEKIEPKVGDAICGDYWPVNGAESLQEGTEFKDSSFPGCQFYVTTHNGFFTMAVNVTVTGKPHYCYTGLKSRCKIEFVGDGEPSQFSGGWLYHHSMKR